MKTEEEIKDKYLEMVGKLNQIKSIGDAYPQTKDIYQINKSLLEWILEIDQSSR